LLLRKSWRNKPMHGSGSIDSVYRTNRIGPWYACTRHNWWLHPNAFSASHMHGVPVN
jgi:hypothetical protein